MSEIAKQKVLDNIREGRPVALETGIALACVGIYDLTQAYIKSLELANKAVEESLKELRR